MVKKDWKKTLLAFLLFLIGLSFSQRGCGKVCADSFCVQSTIGISSIRISELLYFLVIYFLSGWDVICRAVRNIRHGQVFDENFLMTIATVGAFIIGEYSEGVAVMIFYQVGELFQSYAVNQSRESISALMDIMPEFAHVKRDGEVLTVDPDEVDVEEYIVIKPGERIPLDAVITEGMTTIDTQALTGESLPREVQVGDEIISGCINLNGLITAQVTKTSDESTVATILDLVENAAVRKAKSELFITKFARYYTPIVVSIAALLFLLMPLITGDPWMKWGYRAMSFLVISCPCALVISVPLSFFGGIGGASKRGLLVKGSNFLETLAKANTFVFDKTGTLTKGVFKVTEINPHEITEEQLTEWAAHAERYSNHPIAESIVAFYGKEPDMARVQSVQEIAGRGLTCEMDGKKILVGNEKLMRDHQIDIIEPNKVGTVVYVAVDNMFCGSFVIADEVKEDSKKAIQDLKSMHIQTVMLTGDKKNVAESIGKELGIDQVYAELLPQDKVAVVERLLQKNRSSGKAVAFVGDGINDAPVLARVDIGLAMGAMGSDAAIEAADIVIMDDRLSKIKTAMKVSKKTMSIVYQNILFAIGIKILVLILSAIGMTSMWAAIFADVGVTVLAILNSFRALNTKSL